jgi:hypothetical protein
MRGMGLQELKGIYERQGLVNYRPIHDWHGPETHSMTEKDQEEKVKSAVESRSDTGTPGKKELSPVDAVTDDAARKFVSFLGWLYFALIFKKMIKDVLIAGTITALLVVLGWRYGHWLFTNLERIVGIHPAQFLLSIGIIAAGIGAYYFKKNAQRYYGAVETAFGMTSSCVIAFTMSLPAATLAQWASLISCGYVIQRGLNNIREGTPKPNFPKNGQAVE